MVGKRWINHLVYADDPVVFCPYSAGLEQLIKICSKYGVPYDIKYNAKKSLVIITRTKEDRKQIFTPFFLADQEFIKRLLGVIYVMTT